MNIEGFIWPAPNIIDDLGSELKPNAPGTFRGEDGIGVWGTAGIP